MNDRVSENKKLKYVSCVIGFKLRLLTNLIKLALGGDGKVLDDDTLAYFLSVRQIVRTLRARIKTLKIEKIINFSNHEGLETNLDTLYYGEVLAWQDQPYLTKSIRKLNNFELKALDFCHDSLFVTEKFEQISAEVKNESIESLPEAPHQSAGQSASSVTTTTNLENFIYDSSSYNPFDIRTATWLDGKSIIRSNKPLPESHFPKIKIKNGLTLRGSTILISTINLPISYLTKNTHIFFDLVNYYPEFNILGLGELYLSKNIQLDIPKRYDFGENGVGDEITKLGRKFLKRSH